MNHIRISLFLLLFSGFSFSQSNTTYFEEICPLGYLTPDGGDACSYKQKSKTTATVLSTLFGWTGADGYYVENYASGAIATSMTVLGMTFMGFSLRTSKNLSNSLVLLGSIMLTVPWFVSVLSLAKNEYYDGKGYRLADDVDDPFSVFINPIFPTSTTTLPPPTITSVSTPSTTVTLLTTNPPTTSTATGFSSTSTTTSTTTAFATTLTTASTLPPSTTSTTEEKTKCRFQIGKDGLDRISTNSGQLCVLLNQPNHFIPIGHPMPDTSNVMCYPLSQTDVEVELPLGNDTVMLQLFDTTGLSFGERFAKTKKVRATHGMCHEVSGES